MSENVIGNTTHKTEHLIRYYHYHNTINVLGEVCREFVSIPPKGGLTWSEETPWYYDDSMKRVANAVREFEKKAIGDVRVDRKSTRLNSSHSGESRMPSSA